MAGTQKITDYPAIAALGDDDLLDISIDLGGGASETRSITKADLIVTLGVVQHASTHFFGGSDAIPGGALLDNYVVIQALADFPTPVSGVITLDTGILYQINGIIDIGSNRINFGGSPGMFGTQTVHDRIHSTTTGALLTAGTNQVIECNLLGFQCPNGSLIDFVGTFSPLERVIFLTCEFNDFASLGTSSNLFIMALTDCGFSNIDDGFVFSGTNFLFRFKGGVYSSVLTTNNFFDLGTAQFISFSIEGISSIVVDAGATFLSGLAANGNLTTGSGVFKDNIIGGAGTALAGIDCLDVKWSFTGNSQFSNLCESIPDGNIFIADGDEVETTIGVGDGDLGNPKLIAGTWTTEADDRFTATAAGRLTYDGLETKSFIALASFKAEIPSGTNKDFNVFFAKNGTVIASTRFTVNVDSGTPQSGTVVGNVNGFVTTDFLEIFVENISDTTNITLSAVNFILN